MEVYKQPANYFTKKINLSKIILSKIVGYTNHSFFWFSKNSNQHQIDILRSLIIKLWARSGFYKTAINLKS